MRGSALGRLVQLVVREAGLERRHRDRGALPARGDLEVEDRAGDHVDRAHLDELLALAEEKMGNDCDSTPQEDEALIYGRNTNWAGLMPAIMQQAPTLFVVGAAHLPGSRGVLGLLRAKGYTVEPMQ